MTSKQKLMLNSIMGLMRQAVALVCGFILPRYMLFYYGSSVNGLVSSLTNFLGFITVMEMGIGPVIHANLYKPLAEKDEDQISRIIISAERFFRRLAMIFLGYIAVLVVLLPRLVDTDQNWWFSASLLLIISFSTFAEYFFGAANQALLNADQKAYIQLSLQIIMIILNTVLSVLMMKLGASIHLVKLISTTIYCIRPLGQVLYVRKHYRINKKLELREEPIQQKWNGFAQHMASALCARADIAILTVCSTLTSVSVYSVYFNVVNGITLIIGNLTSGVSSYAGNLYARNDRNELLSFFQKTEWMMHFVTSFAFTVTAVTIAPFVQVYTKGIEDAEYVLPAFGVLMAIAFASNCLRWPYFHMVNAAGHFRQTQWGMIGSAALNILVSVILVYPMGLLGIALGTVAGMMFQTCYLAWYLRSNILHRPIRYFILLLLTDALVFGITFLLTGGFTMGSTTYFSWVLLAIRVSLITLIVSLVVNLVLHFRTVRSFLKK